MKIRSWNRGVKALFIVGMIAFVFSACSSSGSSGDSSAPKISSFEITDPTPGANDNFGEKVVILANGNIVVSDPNDSSVATNNGAVHLYDPVMQTRIASFYGDDGGDFLGGTNIVALPNSNFVIVSEKDNVGAIKRAGSVILVDGNTGEQIGATITGDVASDQLGSYPGVIALPNNNFVIAAPNDDEGGIVDAGSVRLIDGNTGTQIGATITGDVAGDRLGDTGLTALNNNNFVVVSRFDENGGMAEAGSVRLLDGSTGAQIRTTIEGDASGDGFLIRPAVALANNNYVVASPYDDEGGIVDGGAVRLFDGSTGVQIGTTIAGDNPGDNLGGSGITALSNNNFVIASPRDDEGGIVDAGSIHLVDGSTGLQIGATLAGDNSNDKLGGFAGITALANNNFVVAARDDDVAGIVDAGSVRLIDGSTGLQIGSTIAGDDDNDQFGRTRAVALANNNFVIASPIDDEAGVVNAGSVRLVDGGTGIQIGASIVGDTDFDLLGGAVTALGNNNFVISSSVDDEGGIVDAGSARLVDGSTGVQIGTPLIGDNTEDFLSFSNGTDPVALATNNFVVVSAYDDIEGLPDVGSVRLVDGSTGLQIGDSIIGSAAEDFDVDASITPSETGLYYILGAPFADNGGMVDSGLVRVVVP